MYIYICRVRTENYEYELQVILIPHSISLFLFLSALHFKIEHLSLFFLWGKKFPSLQEGTQISGQENSGKGDG
jgi:hypothetical protein